MKKEIDWFGTLRNFVVLVVLSYTILSAYLIVTYRDAFEKYQKYNATQAALTSVSTLDPVKIKRNAGIAAITSYATFTADCIILAYYN